MVTSDGLDDQLNQMCSDGRITVEDADEVRRFADFLVDVGQYEKGSPEASRCYLEHYPEDERS